VHQTHLNRQEEIQWEGKLDEYLRGREVRMGMMESEEVVLPHPLLPQEKLDTQYHFEIYKLIFHKKGCSLGNFWDQCTP
jgi:hypothetical protein